MYWFNWAWGEAIARSFEATDSSARPSSHELDVITVLAEVLAAESLCRQCLAPLSDRVVTLPDAGAAEGSWALCVVTSCRNWRRHRHIARVTEKDGHLTFEPFSRRRFAQQ